MIARIDPLVYVLLRHELQDILPAAVVTQFDPSPAASVFEVAANHSVSHE